jgi:hypothetical protein
VSALETVAVVAAGAPAVGSVNTGGGVAGAASGAGSSTRVTLCRPPSASSTTATLLAMRSPVALISCLPGSIGCATPMSADGRRSPSDVTATFLPSPWTLMVM